MKGGTSSSIQGQQTPFKTEKQPTHGKFQPTAEQVRYAHLLNSEDPPWLKEKIHQVVDLTKKPQDEVAIALHDCDYSVSSAVINLLEGKYDQGEWTTFSNRKKKAQVVDSISSVSGKSKPVPASTKPVPTTTRPDQKEIREGSGNERSQSVEYNNRKNKGQPDRTTENNDTSKHNGPLSNTRPPGGGRNRNREDRGDRGDRGDQSDRGDCSDQRERGDRGVRGNRGDRGNRGNRGDRGDRGDQGVRGDRVDRGNRTDQGDRGDRGDRKPGGRGGFGRRGGINRGGRGGSRSRGRFSNNNNRTYGRRPEQVNGPSKDTDFAKKGESWGDAPENEEKDQIVSDFTITQDWGAEDWGSEQRDTIGALSSTSWETPDKGEKDITWEVEATPQKTLSNHVNHLPECDDEAILSSKVASTSSESTNNLDDLSSFSAPSSVTSQPFTRDSVESLALSDSSRTQVTCQSKSMSSQPSLDGSNSNQPQPQRQQKASRTRRVQKSQIPKQPVEMPGNNGGMDSLDVQFGNLEFGGESITDTKVAEETAPSSTSESITTSKPVAPSPVDTTVTPPVSKPAGMVTTTSQPESSAVTSFEQMSPRHYAPPGTPVSKPSVNQLTPEASPRKDKPDLLEPKTPPMIKKVDVSTSPLPLSSTMTVSIPKSNNGGTVSRGTSYHSQVEAIATSDERLDDRVHHQAPALGHSSSPRSDQNTMRSRLPGIGSTTSSSTTRSNPTTAGVSLSSSVPAGPPPGIIPGIQTNVSATNSAGPSKGSSSSTANSRQQPHGTKPPNLPPGVLPLYGIQPAPSYAGFSPLAYPLDDIQMIQRMQMPPYYDMSFPVAGRDGVQASYSGADVKYNRNDTSSPVPSSLTAGPHGQQTPFMNTHAQLHPFGYGNLAFYPGGGMIGGFAPYTTQMYQLPTKGPGVSTQFQPNFGNQPGPHYTSGYDGLANAHDFGKQGYQHPTQSKANSVSGTSASNSSDLSTPAYKPQFTDKGYLSGTPPPLNLSLSGQGHQPHPAGFPLMPVIAPTQHPPSLFQGHHLSHQQQLDTINQSRGQQNQGKSAQNKSHHGQSMYHSPPFWSGTN